MLTGSWIMSRINGHPSVNWYWLSSTSDITHDSSTFSCFCNSTLLGLLWHQLKWKRSLPVLISYSQCFFLPWNVFRFDMLEKESSNKYSEHPVSSHHEKRELDARIFAMHFVYTCKTIFQTVLWSLFFTLWNQSVYLVCVCVCARVCKLLLSRNLCEDSHTSLLSLSTKDSSLTSSSLPSPLLLRSCLLWLEHSHMLEFGDQLVLKTETCWPSPCHRAVFP